jgi:hypothetical protein
MTTQRSVRDSARVRLLRRARAYQQTLLDRDRRRGWASPESIQRIEERMARVERLIEDAEQRGL